MGPCKHDTCGPNGIRTRGTVGHLQLFQRRPGEGPSRDTVHGGKNFTIFFKATYCKPPCLSCRCPRQSPSRQPTIPPGTATIVPTPDEHSSCVRPRQRWSVPDRPSKIPDDYAERPSLGNDEQTDGTAPLPLNAVTWS